MSGTSSLHHQHLEYKTAAITSRESAISFRNRTSPITTRESEITEIKPSESATSAADRRTSPAISGTSSSFALSSLSRKLSGITMTSASSNALLRFPPEGTDHANYYQQVPYDSATLRVLHDYGRVFIHTRTGSLFISMRRGRGFITLTGSDMRGTGNRNAGIDATIRRPACRRAGSRTICRIRPPTFRLTYECSAVTTSTRISTSRTRRRARCR